MEEIQCYTGSGGYNEPDENDAEDAGTSPGSAGTMRKATGSGRSGKRKTRKI